MTGDCTVFRDRISQHLDRRLSPVAASAFEHHAAACEPCRRVLDETSRLRQLLRGFAPEDAGALPLDDLVRRTREASRAAVRSHHLRLAATLAIAGVAIAGVAIAGIVAGAAHLPEDFPKWGEDPGPVLHEYGRVRVGSDDPAVLDALARHFETYPGRVQVAREKARVTMAYGGPVSEETERFHEELRRILETHGKSIRSVDTHRGTGRK